MNTATNVYGPEIYYDVEDEYLVEINKNRLAYNPSWLYEKMTEGLLSEQNLQEIIAMSQILEEVYPGLWDIKAGNLQYKFVIDFENNDGYGLSTFKETRKINKLYFQIIIKFPEITITNTAGFSHDIKDLYVQTKIMPVYDSHYTWYQGVEENYTESIIAKLREYNGFYCEFKTDYKVQELHGRRGKLSVYEYNSGYRHSHLWSGATHFKDWTIFCLGLGQIKDTMAVLARRFSPEVFNMYLLQIDAYVRWESVEGVPHIHMSTIKGGGALSALPVVTYPQNFYSRLQNILKTRFLALQESDIPQLTWKLDNGFMRIVEDQKFDTFLTYTSNPIHYNNEEIYYIDVNGVMYARDAANAVTMPTNITQVTLLFQGQDVKLEVYETERPQLQPDFLIHPQIKKYVKRKLENYANFKRIKNSISTRAAQIAHSSRGIR